MINNQVAQNYCGLSLEWEYCLQAECKQTKTQPTKKKGRKKKHTTQNKSGADCCKKAPHPPPPPKKKERGGRGEVNSACELGISNKENLAACVSL